MPITALLALASAAATVSSTPGVELASAQARAAILRPAIVRQRSGWEDRATAAPRPQVNRRDGTTLIEFE